MSSVLKIREIRALIYCAISRALYWAYSITLTCYTLCTFILYSGSSHLTVNQQSRVPMKSYNVNACACGCCVDNSRQQVMTTSQHQQQCQTTGASDGGRHQFLEFGFTQEQVACVCEVITTIHLHALFMSYRLLYIVKIELNWLIILN